MNAAALKEVEIYGCCLDGTSGCFEGRYSDGGNSGAGCALSKETDMKKLVLATSLFALFSWHPRTGADMARKAPAPITTVPSWAGFYLGVHGGYGWNDDDFRINVIAEVGGPFGGILKSRGTGCRAADAVGCQPGTLRLRRSTL